MTSLTIYAVTSYSGSSSKVSNPRRMSTCLSFTSAASIVAGTSARNSTSTNGNGRTGVRSLATCIFSRTKGCIVDGRIDLRNSNAMNRSCGIAKRNRGRSVASVGTVRIGITGPAARKKGSSAAFGIILLTGARRCGSIAGLISLRKGAAGSVESLGTMKMKGSCLPVRDPRLAIKNLGPSSSARRFVG